MSNNKALWLLACIICVLGAVLWFTSEDQPAMRPGMPGPHIPTPEEERQARAARSEAAKTQLAKQEEQRLAEKKRAADARHDAMMRIDQVARTAVEQSKTQRWTDLPSQVRCMFIDLAGRPWFTLTPTDSASADSDTIRSAEEVFAGKAMCIVSRTDQPLLVDSRGMLWIRLDRKLAGYDGKQWIYLDAEGKPTDLATWLVRGHISKWSVEDTAGGLWFMTETSRTDGEPGTVQILLQRTADGKWKDHRFTDFDLPLDPDQTVVLPGGKLLLVETDRERLAYFDGSEWKVDHKVDKTLRRSISWLTPMADGSIAYVEYQTQTLWFHWPDSKLADNPLNRQWISEMDSDDVGVRQNATVALLRNGQAIRPLLQQALARESCTPEMRLRLQSVMALLEEDPSANLREVARKNADFPGRDLLPGQTYHNLELVAARNGKALLRAERCVNSETGDPVPDQYLELSGMGQIRPIPLSAEPWSGDSQRHSYSPFADRLGRVWLSGGCRIRPDGMVEDALPAGVTAKDVHGPDAHARMYLDEGRILNEAIGVAAPALPEQLVLAPASTFASAGQRLWIVHGDRWPHRLSLMVSGENPVPVTTPWTDAGITAQYCFGPGVLLSLAGKDQDSFPDYLYAFYDGSTWDNDNDLPALVKRNVAFLRKHANRHLKGNASARFGGTQDRFWFYQYVPRFWTDDQGEDKAVLELYDGAAWHDVAGKLPVKLNQYSQMLLVDGGRSLLVVDNVQGRGVLFWLATLEQGQVKVKLLRELPPRMWAQDVKAIYLADQTWLSGLNRDGRISVLRDGTLSDFEAGGDHLLLGDSAGRGWHYDSLSKQVKVYDSGAWAHITIDGAELARSMGEDPDGRLWLVHGKALSQLSAEKRNGELTVKEVARYAWGQARNRAEQPAFDAFNGLWLLAQPRGWIRIQLPKP